MDVIAAMFKGGVQPDANPHVCPLSPVGADKDQCIEMSGRNPEQNKNNCCGTQRGGLKFGPCNCIHRRCIQCLEMGRRGLKAGRVTNVIEGTCDEHAHSSTAESTRSVRIPADPSARLGREAPAFGQHREGLRAKIAAESGGGKPADAPKGVRGPSGFVPPPRPPVEIVRLSTPDEPTTEMLPEHVTLTGNNNEAPADLHGSEEAGNQDLRPPLAEAETADKDSEPAALTTEGIDTEKVSPEQPGKRRPGKAKDEAKRLERVAIFKEVSEQMAAQKKKITNATLARTAAPRVGLTLESALSYYKRNITAEEKRTFAQFPKTAEGEVKSDVQEETKSDIPEEAKSDAKIEPGALDEVKARAAELDRMITHLRSALNAAKDAGIELSSGSAEIEQIRSEVEQMCDRLFLTHGLFMPK